jgi:hypothetical protein
MSILSAFALFNPLAAAVAGAQTAEQTQAAPQSVERWGIFELSLTGPTEGNPFREVTLSARFQQGDHTLEAEGFYDGEIRSLQIFGSRVGGRGAMNLENIRGEMP